MKCCTYCGKEYPDELEFCPADRHPLRPVGEAPVVKPQAAVAPPRDEISAAEKSFWERMTFRQFAILMIRLQALWLFFNGTLDITYLTRYVVIAGRVSAFAAMSLYEKREFFMLLFRIFLHFGAGMLLIQKAEKILSWLVKDYVAESVNQKS